MLIGEYSAYGSVSWNLNRGQPASKVATNVTENLSGGRDFSFSAAGMHAVKTQRPCNVPQISNGLRTGAEYIKG